MVYTLNMSHITIEKKIKIYTFIEWVKALLVRSWIEDMLYPFYIYLRIYLIIICFI